MAILVWVLKGVEGIRKKVGGGGRATKRAPLRAVVNLKTRGLERRVVGHAY